MNSDNTNRSLDSVETYPNRQRRAASESEFLAEQAAEAKAALRNSVHEIVDVRSLVQRSPWLALGSAALAGAVTARLTRRNRPAAQAQVIHVVTTPKARRTVPPIVASLLGTALRFAGQMLLLGTVAPATAHGTDEASESDEDVEPHDPD